jgi:menaquinone-specific isochorismate synthase
LSALHNAIQSLKENIENAKPSDVRVGVDLDWPADKDLIDWFDAQPIFPKFYWQSRNAQQETIALGQVRTFTDPSVAQSALGEDQRIWGGRSFDGRTARNKRCMSSFFFLPQFEVSRVNNSWQLVVNLCDDNSQLLSRLSTLTDNVMPLNALKCNIVSKQHAPEFSDWSTMVNKALDGINNKIFEKVVLARKTTLTLSHPLSSSQLLKASRATNTDSFHFMMALDHKHCFIGSTPERLYVRNGSDIHTEALAGTIGRGINGQEDQKLASWLFNDEKNRYENHLVVEDIVSRLNHHCSTVNVTKEPELVKLRKVQHLKRDISGQLNSDFGDASLLDSLQPTAAIAGLPREAALNFIADHEPFARGWYSGAVGFLSEHQSEFCVAIRSALVKESELHLFAGAGIVPGSKADSEWQELDRKTSTLYSLLEPELNLSEPRSA